VGNPDYYRMLALSPVDDNKAAAAVGGFLEVPIGRRDIRVFDLNRETTTRVTSDTQQADYPIWSLDGSRLWYWSGEGGGGIYSKPASGLGASKFEFKPEGPGELNPVSLSPDGNHLVYVTSSGTARSKVWIHPLGEETDNRKDYRLIETDSQVAGGRFSPDGCWIAYSTNETGRHEINVLPFPNRDNKVTISTSGGTHPRWRRDGGELFYIGLDGNMMAVALDNKCNSLSVLGEPKALFQTRIVTTSVSEIHYDVTDDGQRFLVNSLDPKPITLSVNWTAALGN
jgi:Tol biopolymer transport system component